MEILIVFLLKLLGNTLCTMKNICLTREKFFFSSLLAALSTTVYMIAVVRMAKSDGILSIVAICTATFIGTLIPRLVVKKSEKEKLYIFDITADNINNGKEFADILRSVNIPTKTSVVYDTMMIKTLSIKAYCANKKESKMVNKVIYPDFKYNVYVPMSLD
ncbi:hypothetical protein Ccar_13975 [Clostridium carboxidivorans P7]|uniref:Uncharacterized protein n=1 Tax=Clostridium carboxidivorans P7 TaxID=536227 RepID=C6PS45_9CLOT|nr:hypothetical protein [Clostridium carboxidivorans]AKN31907.1 hypothetical protein Ccar_13975 [Clostridium carboxidivorans P7]EET87970.1 conserved hypothetical protein [Clostridium carboxidivorans P7]